MKANVKKEKQKNKVKFGDKAMNFLFCDIIDALIKRYDESDEKETMSFKAYCIRLRDLSNKQAGKDVNTDIDSAEEYAQKILEEGEKIDGERSY